MSYVSNSNLSQIYRPVWLHFIPQFLSYWTDSLLKLEDLSASKVSKTKLQTYLFPTYFTYELQVFAFPSVIEDILILGCSAILNIYIYIYGFCSSTGLSISKLEIRS